MYPTKSFKSRVPQVAWSGMSYSVSHLIVLGCVAYDHVPKELRRKLDARNGKCIFFGYSEQSKSHKMYNPVTKKFIISSDLD